MLQAGVAASVAASRPSGLPPQTSHTQKEIPLIAEAKHGLFTTYLARKSAMRGTAVLQHIAILLKIFFTHS